MSAPTPKITSAGPHLLSAHRYANNTLVPWHQHSGTELVLVTEGQCEIEVGGPPPAAVPASAPRAAPLQGLPQTLFILPARVPQQQRNMAFTRTTYAIFSLSGFAFDESARVVNLATAPEIGRWLEDLCELARVTDQNTDAVTRGVLMAVLERVKLLEREREANIALHPGLTRALEYLRIHLVNKLSLGEVAQACGVSESHLRALFRKQFGHGPMQHLQALRMDLAKKLLPHPYLRIQEVARECGYDDAKYFTRHFTKATGKTPRDWRG